MATCADVLGQTLPPDAGEDSVSFLPALRGEPIVSGRSGVVHHSISGHFAYRHGKWKLLLARGSGGWTHPNEKQAAAKGAPKGQLYDIHADPGETNNLFESEPQVVERLLEMLKTDVRRGRSTPGPDQANDVPVQQIKLWKSE